MPTRSGLDYSISRNQSQVAMTETMPEWAKDLVDLAKDLVKSKDLVDLAKDLKISIDQNTQKIDQSNQKINKKIDELSVELCERLDKLLIKRGIATELKPMQENDEGKEVTPVESVQADSSQEIYSVQESDEVAAYKSDESEAELKPMDMEDPDEVKDNKVEAVSIDQLEQDCDEVFKLSTDKLDGENGSGLAINGEGSKKDAVIVPHCPSTTTISHTSASSSPLLVFVLKPLCSPPCHNLYLICWKGHTSSDDSWSSRNKLWWLDPDLLKQYQSDLMQDPIDSTPFDPGGIVDDHVASSRGDPPLLQSLFAAVAATAYICNSTESSFSHPGRIDGDIFYFFPYLF